jgi:hypothetical protein
MLIGYLTTDATNLDLAERLARACKAELLLLSMREALQEDLIDAVVYDLDYLPAEMRQEVLALLLASRVPYPVAVHSYNLEKGQRLALRATGVLVARRLGRKAFLALCRKVHLGQRAVRGRPTPDLL